MARQTELDIDDDNEEWTVYEYWEEEFRERERMEERYTCVFGADCCMPGEHTSDECHTAEMIEAQMAEYEKEANQ
jgi:hypothetical protein